MPISFNPTINLVDPSLPIHGQIEQNKIWGFANTSKYYDIKLLLFNNCNNRSNGMDLRLACVCRGEGRRIFVFESQMAQFRGDSGFGVMKTDGGDYVIDTFIFDVSIYFCCYQNYNKYYLYIIVISFKLILYSKIQHRKSYFQCPYNWTAFNRLMFSSPIIVKTLQCQLFSCHFWHWSTVHHTHQHG